jgi:TRAP-type mannitol/chloroaromatic compound transport system permease large subunit
MGAGGASAMAMLRKRLSVASCCARRWTPPASCLTFVLFILVGSTVFSASSSARSDGDLLGGAPADVDLPGGRDSGSSSR